MSSRSEYRLLLDTRPTKNAGPTRTHAKSNVQYSLPSLPKLCLQPRRPATEPLSQAPAIKARKLKSWPWFRYHSPRLRQSCALPQVWRCIRSQVVDVPRLFSFCLLHISLQRRQASSRCLRVENEKGEIDTVDTFNYNPQISI